MSSPKETDFSQTVYNVAPSRLGANGNRLPVLVVLRGAQVGRRYLLNEDCLVMGRRPDKAQLLVPGDAQVSSVHCRFERTPATSDWQVVDLQSTNGTLVGGERVAKHALRDGDRLLVGETVFKFTYHDELEAEYHEQVNQLMNIDDLTGLPVQRVFQTRLHEALQACTQRRRPMAVFMMDMDGLKKMNDTHGHFVGANAIATVGRRLGRIVGEAGGVVSRFGGDEFSAFVPDADRTRALELGERMRAAVADEPIVGPTATVSPTMSIGLATSPEDGKLAEQITRKADDALYRAKAAGRNCVRD